MNSYRHPAHLQSDVAEFAVTLGWAVTATALVSDISTTLRQSLSCSNGALELQGQSLGLLLPAKPTMLSPPLEKGTVVQAGAQVMADYFFVSPTPSPRQSFISGWDCSLSELEKLLSDAVSQSAAGPENEERGGQQQVQSSYYSPTELDTTRLPTWVTWPDVPENDSSFV